jgi:hypothetical protein
MVLVVLGIFNVCDLILCVVSVVRSIRVRGSFYGFNLWICPGYIFKSCDWLLMYSSFPDTTLGFRLFSGAYPNKLTVSMVPSDIKYL